MRVVALAYACEPGKGSEPGAGWAWVRMIARLADVTVVTRANNRGVIEACLPELAERDSLHFVYVDLPPWARRWKRGRRGIRLYYLLWQGAALRAVRHEHAQAPFDLFWHVTLANVWLGSIGGLIPVPSVLGPVGGTVSTPARMLPVLGVAGSAQEILRVGVLTAARYVNPLARMAWRRAGLILVNNAETLRWLPRRHQAKALVFPNPALSDLPVHISRVRGTGPLTAVFAGRLIPWKGGALAIAALGHLPRWRLVFCGEGSDERRLRRLATRAGVAQRVAFTGWVPRAELLRILQEEADVFLFPSLRDEAPWALAEAICVGLPTVCLDRGGPVGFGGVTVPLGTRHATAMALAGAVARSTEEPPAPQDRFRFEIRVADLRRVLARHQWLREPCGS